MRLSNRNRVGSKGIVRSFAVLVFGFVIAPCFAQEGGSSAVDEKVEKPAFERVRRPRAVDVTKEYDVSGLTLPLDEIHELLPRDAIASLTNPKLEKAVLATWMKPEDRVLDVTIGGESVAVPFRILNFHEIANLVVGGEPVAATY